MNTETRGQGVAITVEEVDIRMKSRGIEPKPAVAVEASFLRTPRPMRKATLLVLPFLGLLLAGCPDDPVSSAEASCASYYDALTAKVSSCGSSRFGDRSRFLTLCKSAVASPGSGVNESFLSSCTNSIKGEASCETETTACKTPAGTLAEGAGCSAGSQCGTKFCQKATPDALCGKCGPPKAVGAECDPKVDRCVDNAYCESVGAAPKGTCKASPARLKEGDACGVSGVESFCDTGLTCDYAGTKKCVKEGALGAACGTGKPSCASKLTCKDGKCSEPPGEGEACSTDASGLSCKSGFACDAEAKKCVKIVYAKPGEPCDITKTRCEKGSCRGVKYEGSKIIPGKCPTILADGAACDPQSPDSDCDDFANCLDKKCQIPDGSSCK